MTEPVAAVLLAGGQARRLGGIDKMLIKIGGQTLLDRVASRIRPQVSAMLLSANGDPARFVGCGIPVRADVVAGYAGPLAGILTGLEWLRDEHPEISWLASVATDTPLIPEDYVARLLHAVQSTGADVACAQSGDIRHPVQGLWPVRLAADLRRALTEEGLHEIGAWADRHKVAKACWQGGAADPFFNINNREDVVRFGMIVDHTLPGVPPPSAVQPADRLMKESDWMVLSQTTGRDVHPATTLSIALDQACLAGYRANLNNREPQLFAVLRQALHGTLVIGITAAPDEAMSLRTGEDLIAAMPMPTAVQDWVLSFVAQHPAELPMKKRLRDHARW
ncbi:molybdenum cofactor guanylyltransferase MobA [Telmatospirillum sp.]|uniref:molybdenum cofactor guanylyltransferase MobA n=1 Tax=Telmatospirillum sp. TaxID=2079197 RepID=UPI00284DC653|nr:molybdenum cofactor guanylyltransferase MobA [Telmatospirillum sp.]MDR3437057.1 molybdenum cofactor guanylyltransferase MobA [Telmatospirillum sp.]